MSLRCLVFSCWVVTTAASGFAADWPRFLGSGGASRGDEGSEPPTEWGPDGNIRWRVELPGKGVSSPIVVGDRVLVTCYSGYGTGGREERPEDLVRHLVCVDRRDGQVLWNRTIASLAPEDPYTGIGVTAHGYASHTPVSDGESVFAFFGKSGVFAFDLEGERLWHAEVGRGSGPQRWGSAASPIVYEDFVIINAADESESLIALDKRTGAEVWRSEAPSLQGSWSTPALVDGGDGIEMVLMVPGEVWGLNPENGKLRWYSRGINDSTACSSIVPGDGVVYAVGGRGGEAVAVRLGGRGNVDESHVVWDGNIPGRFSTPVLHDGHLYCYSNAVLSVYNSATGERVGQRRLSDEGPGTRREPERAGATEEAPGGRRGGRGRGGMGSSDYASPIIAGGKLYVTSRSGSVFVLAADPGVEVLAVNRFEGDSGFGGTPASSDGQLFFRSDRYLYCVAGD